MPLVCLGRLPCGSSVRVFAFVHVLPRILQCWLRRGVSGSASLKNDAYVCWCCESEHCGRKLVQ